MEQQTDEQAAVKTPTFFDASGGRVRDQAGYLAARMAAAGISTATACLELHAVGLGSSVVYKIQVIVNSNTYPFLILGGTIGGDICNRIGTHWVVVGGSLGPNLIIEAKRLPLVNAPSAIGSAATGSVVCATSMTIVGHFQVPDSYAGTYGTEGSSSDFSHTTLFKGWQACA